MIAPIAHHPKARSLGAKLLLVLALVGVGGAAAITLLLTAVITPSFNTLERQQVAQQVARTHAVLDEFATKVENSTRDYGDWDDSYDYLAKPTAKFEQASFSPLAMVNLDVAGMAYVANDGRVVIARWHDPQHAAAEAGMRAALIGLIGRTDFARLLGHRHSGHFYARLGDSLAAIGVAEVHRSNGEGARRGLVLMARTMGSAKLSALLQMQAEVPLWRYDREPAIRRAPRRLTITVPIAGADGMPVAAARFGIDRDVSLLGHRMLLLAAAGTTLLLVLVLGALSRLVTYMVLRPLGRVEAHMQAVRASGALDPLDGDARADEIGSLGRSFNAMLGQLSDLREQLEVQSFALGKSESAVAVMHNVRNALNPISTILSQGIALPPPIDRALVERAVGELGRDDLPAPRRAKLAAFVAAAVAAEATDRAMRASQLQIGREAMAHVLEIIGSQQAQAHERPPLETVNVSEIVAQNATIARYAQGISIAFSFPARAHPALANRLLLSQVIGNLFANAAESIAARDAGSGAITVTIEESAGSVTIAIRDDGEGFDPEAAPGLFQRGFSTRAHKSGGLGLHWCANSVNAMGGALKLTSEGRGRGAVALLTLRAAETALRQAA